MDKDFNALADAYEEKKNARLEEIIQSGGMDNEYTVKTQSGVFLLTLPKRVLEQKRLLHLGHKWWATKIFLPLPENTDPKTAAEIYHKWENETKNDPDVEEKFVVAILPHIRKNGKGLLLDELEIGEINALAQLYWDFMLYPFSVRAITTSNKILVNA